MKLSVVMAVVLLGMSCVAQTVPGGEEGARIHSIVENVVSDYEIPGLSIAILSPEYGTYFINKGNKRVGSEKTISETTLFSAQSMSKTFTALATLIAVKEGILNLDVPIKRYMPSFVVNSTHEPDAFSRITLRHLLSHTSGLPPDAPEGNIFSSQYEGGVYTTLENRINSLRHVWLRSKVGTRYGYSNIAFDLVARVIELSSGMDFHDYMRMKVLIPLNMYHSTFNLDVIQERPNVAFGHCNNFDGRVPVRFSSVGAGRLYTCSKDMVNFLRSAMKGFPEILDLETYDELISIPFSDEESGYALGLTISDIQYCTQTLGHTGNGFGFTSLMQWIPEFGLGIAILSNRESTYSGLQDILEKVISSHEGLNIDSLPCRDLEKFKNHLDEEDLEHFKRISGDYSNGNVTLTFELRDSMFGVLAPDDGSFNKIYFLSRNNWLIEDGEIVQFLYKNKQIVNLNNGMTFLKLDNPSVEKDATTTIRNEYVGRYRSYAYGVLESIEIIDQENGVLRLNGIPLQEYLPGLFFDQFGQVVDFRGENVLIEYGEYIKIE